MQHPAFGRRRHSESDVGLAGASQAIIFGFNVRANPQARDLAKQEHVDIRYYSIIYDLIDDMRGLMSGLLAPEIRENTIGYAEIREVFNITKTGKVAGCYVTEGFIRRGTKVRLLRDNVVIFDGALKTLNASRTMSAKCRTVMSAASHSKITTTSNRAMSSNAMKSKRLSANFRGQPTGVNGYRFSTAPIGLPGFKMHA